MLTFSFPCSCSSFPLRGSVFFTFWIALWEVANALSIFLKLASFAFFTAISISLLSDNGYCLLLLFL